MGGQVMAGYAGEAPACSWATIAYPAGDLLAGELQAAFAACVRKFPGVAGVSGGWPRPHLFILAPHVLHVLDGTTGRTRGGRLSRVDRESTPTKARTVNERSERGKVRQTGLRHRALASLRPGVARRHPSPQARKPLDTTVSGSGCPPLKPVGKDQGGTGDHADMISGLPPRALSRWPTVPREGPRGVATIQAGCPIVRRLALGYDWSFRSRLLIRSSS